MASNFLTKLFLKTFNKKEYLSQKYEKNLKKNVDFYNRNIRKKIEDIEISLKTKKKLNFLHSGHLGDMIYSLPLIKELSKNYECNLYIQINKKMDLYYHNHPSGDVMINDKSAKLMMPLLKSQTYLNSVKKYEKENIDINLDLFREMPFSLTFHSVRWYSHLTGTQINMGEKFLNLETNENFKDKIVIVRSPRYRNNFINYKFLKEVKNIVCVGLKDEYDDLKKDIKNLEFYDCKDFLEMAVIINSCKFFIGNLCFAYSIAEALKIPRLLETCPDFPVVFPIGKNAFDFYHQIHFEKYFNELNKR
tara:strand:- start:2022 stop:2936 length:915 start_codon:yes stop_codon:yes gene_type:complete